MLALKSLLLFLVLLAAGDFSDTQAKELSPEEVAILGALDQYDKAFESYDLEKMDQVLAEDVDIHSAYLGATFNNKKSFLEALKRKIDTDKTLMTFFRVYRIDVQIKLSGNEAFVSDRVDVERWKPTDRGRWRGQVARETKLRKEDGKWRIFYRR